MNEAMQALVAIAAGEVGVRETGGNNAGERIRLYQSATWLKPDSWPWCAAFTAWVLQQWLCTGYGRTYLGTHKADVWRCKDASAFGWEKWARTKGLQVIPETQLANAGDIVIFDFSHIGFVASNQADLLSPIDTIEGNTNGKGERDSVSGDGVWRKQRKPSLTKCYLRLGERAP